MEATGFGVMHVDEKDRIVSFLEKPKDPPGIPGNPDMALASMGIYVFKHEPAVRPAAPRRGDRRQQPRLRQGHHSVPRRAREGRGPPLRQVLREVGHGGRGLLAGRRDGRRLFRGQHRPDATCPGARSLRSPLADLDQQRDHAAGEVRARRGGSARVRRQLAGLGGLYRLGRQPSRIPAVHGRPRPLLRRARRCGGPALCRHRPVRATDQRRHRPRRAHSRGPGRRRGSGLDTRSASAVPRRACA